MEVHPATTLKYSLELGPAYIAPVARGGRVMPMRTQGMVSPYAVPQQLLPVPLGMPLGIPVGMGMVPVEQEATEEVKKKETEKQAAVRTPSTFSANSPVFVPGGFGLVNLNKGNNTQSDKGKN